MRSDKNRIRSQYHQMQIAKKCVMLEDCSAVLVKLDFVAGV